MLKTSKFKPAHAALLALVAVAGCSAGATETAMSGDSVSCEIDADASGRTLVLQAVIHADRDVTGSYRFQVNGGGSGGSANVSQGGGFNAGPGDDARIGKLMLGNRGGIYDVRVDISAGGQSYVCEKRVGGVI